MHVDPTPSPPPLEIVFDPHVAAALLLLVVALAIVFVVTLIPAAENGHGKR